MSSRIAILLSILGGYVDTLSFLTLQGLFAAHVTGNFVTLGAALVLNRSGVSAKLLALPMFCLMIVLSRLVGHRIAKAGHAPLPIMFGVMVVLFAGATALAFAFGPFTSGDSWMAILTGMVLVSAMAIQNGAQRVHLPKLPPSTLMTGSTTQAMLDVADLIVGNAGEERGVISARLQKLGVSILSFAFGCGLAALVIHFGGMWGYALPPFFAAGLLFLRAEKI